MSKQLNDLLAPVVADLGFELWHLELGAEGQSDYLRVYIDSERGVDLDDCEQVNREIDTTLSVAGYVYALEVSSPGVERPLVTAEHFARFVGERARVKCFAPVGGRRRFHGWIETAGDQQVRLAEADGSFEIDLANVAKAYLDPEALPGESTH